MILHNKQCTLTKYHKDSCIRSLTGHFEIITFLGILTPNGTVSVDCDSTQTFICNSHYELAIGWNITGLSEINITGPFRARSAANSRITSNDTGEYSQYGVSNITISGFNRSDNGGIIRCVNMDNGSVQLGNASISVGEFVGL